MFRKLLATFRNPEPDSIDCHNGSKSSSSCACAANSNQVQTYHFSASGATEEIEEYRVELENVATLELTIIPDVSRGSACASLAELRLG